MNSVLKVFHTWRAQPWWWCWFFHQLVCPLLPARSFARWLSTFGGLFSSFIRSRHFLWHCFVLFGCRCFSSVLLVPLLVVAVVILLLYFLFCCFVLFLYVHLFFNAFVVYPFYQKKKKITKVWISYIWFALKNKWSHLLLWKTFKSVNI